MLRNLSELRKSLSFLTPPFYLNQKLITLKNVQPKNLSDHTFLQTGFWY